MASVGERLGLATEQQISILLDRMIKFGDVKSILHQILDVAIALTGADMGTLQRFDEENDCLMIVASRGISSEALEFFDTVRRDTNSTCAMALARRVRVFVKDISKSYLFVNTPELEVLRATGIAAAQSIPLISSSGRFCGVFTTYFRQPKREDDFNPAPLGRLAVQVADRLEQREKEENLAKSKNVARTI